MGVFNFLKNLSLGVKLNLTLLLALSLLLLAIIFVTRSSLQNFAVQSGRQRVEQEVQLLQKQFALAEQNLLADVNVVSNAPGLAEAVESGDTEQIRLILLTNSARFDFNDMDVVDAGGERLLDLGDELGAGADDKVDDLLALALIGSEATGTLLKDKGTEQELRLAATVPVRNSAGQLIGALWASQALDDEFLNKINFNRQDIQLALLSQGQVLARAVTEFGHARDEELLLEANIPAIVPDQTVNEQVLGGQVVIADNVVTAADGSPHALAYMPLTVGGDTVATVSVLAELSNLFNFQNRLVTYTSLIFGVLALTAMVVVALFVARNISQPINKLRSAAEQMAGGAYDHRAEVKSTDEVGQLGHAFNNMAGQMETLIASLEDQVIARTQRLEAVASLSEQLTPIFDLDELLSQMVNEIQARFGYYHAHVYLLDKAQEMLVVAAGTGRAGLEMKAKGHSIAVNAPTSLVARAARSGEIARVDNVREAPDWLPNPLLPDTYSEMAVPITLGGEGEVVGVLDVQQNKMAGLDEGDASLLRTLANQVAAGIRNAQQFEQVQNALAEAHVIQAQYLEQAWDKSKLSRFTSAQAEVRFAGAASPGQEAGFGPLLTAPIEFRQITIGHLELEDANPQRVWSTDELALVNAVVEQVAQSAENLRLFDETRQRASREQTIREITDKLRAAPNLDRLLEVAARELGQRLGVRHTVLELGIEAASSGGSNGQENEAEGEG